MSTNSILINYIGYPNELFNLSPDNGLATLAACLMEKGHKTTILDYSTVDTIKRLFPYQYEDKMKSLVGKIMLQKKQGIEPDKSDLDSFYKLNEEINEYQKQKVLEIAEEINQFISKNRINFVGFKLWTGAGFDGSMIIAKEIKRKNPKIPIFAGGPHIDWFNEMVFDVTDVFDALAYGEGEETIVGLAEYVEQKAKLCDIPNLIYRENGKITTTLMKRIEDLNKIPAPNYDEDVYPAMGNNQKIKIALIEESRGCPNHCSFCIHFVKSGRKYRTMDPKIVVDRIEVQTNKYGMKAFRFAGSNPPHWLAKDISDEILKRKLKIIFSAFAHIRGIKKDYFEALRRSGCCALGFGIESGSSKILRESMNKRFTKEHIKETIKMCKESGISAIASFIVPAPLETEETKKETFDLIVEDKPDSTVVFFPGIVLGTEWEKNEKKYGFEINDKKEVFKKMMTYKENSLAPSVLFLPFSYYNLNGKSFKVIVEETAEFVKDLKKNNIVTQIFDQIFLIARILNENVQEFQNKTIGYLRSGSYEEIKRIVGKVNNMQ